MATVIIQKRKRNNFTSYMVYYKDPATGEKKYYKTCRKQKDAQKTGNELRALIDNGRINEVEDLNTRIRPLSFSEVAEQLKRKWQNKHERNQISEATINDYTIRLNVLCRMFKQELLGNISKMKLLEIQKQLLEAYSPATSNRYLFILKQVFKHGILIRAIANDRSSDISYLNEDQHKRNNFLVPCEIEKLVAASQKTRAKFYMPALIYLGAEHGASKQEALSLEWNHINFYFNGSGTIRLFRTKNSNERTEYLMPNAKETLIKWKAHLEWMRHRKRIAVKNHRSVFCRLDGTPIKRFDSAWKNICKIAGIKDFHFHDLRHTFCSSLLLSGGNLKDVKEMIGHKDLSMTDRYSHLTNLHKQTLQNNLSHYYQQENNQD